MPQLDVDIQRDLTAPATARRAVERFADHVDATVLPDLMLLVSELMTNAVKYGGRGPVRLILRSEAPRHVHAEVVDQGTGFVPVARARHREEPGGWGLHLVETLSARWGVRARATHVWFEIQR